MERSVVGALQTLRHWVAAGGRIKKQVNSTDPTTMASMTRAIAMESVSHRLEVSPAQGLLADPLRRASFQYSSDAVTPKIRCATSVGQPRSSAIQ